MKQIAHVDEIINDSFGLWISSLFSAISGRNPEISFEDHKESFFWLIAHLLTTGKIKFIAPGADCYISPSNLNPRFTIHDTDAHWQASPREIINYLRGRWPSNASQENDPDLLVYFYEIPSVIWVSETGELVAP
jgi:hypothetical protein